MLKLEDDGLREMKGAHEVRIDDIRIMNKAARRLYRSGMSSNAIEEYVHMAIAIEAKKMDLEE